MPTLADDYITPPSWIYVSTGRWKREHSGSDPHRGRSHNPLAAVCPRLIQDRVLDGRRGVVAGSGGSLPVTLPRRTVGVVSWLRDSTSAAGSSGLPYGQFPAVPTELEVAWADLDSALGSGATRPRPSSSRTAVPETPHVGDSGRGPRPQRCASAGSGRLHLRPKGLESVQLLPVLLVELPQALRTFGWLYA